MFAILSVRGRILAILRYFTLNCSSGGQDSASRRLKFPLLSYGSSSLALLGFKRLQLTSFKNANSSPGTSYSEIMLPIEVSCISCSTSLSTYSITTRLQQ